jgi:DNA polymerase
MRILDFETTSPVDLPTCGVDRYVEEASVLAVGWLDSAGYHRWVPSEGPVPEELLEPGVVTLAHNSRFDRLVWNRVLRRDFPQVPEAPTRQWLDTAMVARAQSLPPHLDQILRAFGLPPKKKTPAVRRLFSTPVDQLPPISDPVWGELLAYLEWDVLGLDQVVDLLDPVDRRAWEEFWASEEINDRGLPVDAEIASRALELLEPVARRFQVEVKLATGLNPTQYVKMAHWVYDRLPSHVKPINLNPETGKP